MFCHNLKKMLFYLHLNKFLTPLWLILLNFYGLFCDTVLFREINIWSKKYYFDFFKKKVRKKPWFYKMIATWTEHQCSCTQALNSECHLSCNIVDLSLIFDKISPFSFVWTNYIIFAKYLMLFLRLFLYFGLKSNYGIY